MTKVNIKALNFDIEVERIIGSIKGAKKSPTVVIMAGIHGNETAGLYALNKVVETIREHKLVLQGNLYALCGNMNALDKGIRFEVVDLNRIWTHDHVAYIKSENAEFSSDALEKIALYQIVKDLLKIEKGPFYFIDLHTTSAETEPFITISDSINNRRFSKKFPVPIILGIEEYLDGPFLSFINEFGHIALGFEAGQHDDIRSIHCSEAFIWMALVNSGCMRSKEVKNYAKYRDYLGDLCKLKKQFFEIDYRHQILNGEEFKMLGTFTNFDKVVKEQPLAESDGLPMHAPFDGRVFMPLYQDQGDDGYFIITKISKFWLAFSTVLRGLQSHNFLRLLPGISRYKKRRYQLLVNRKTARFMATEIFHLFGYRKRVYKDGQWVFTKRDRRKTEFV